MIHRRFLICLFLLAFSSISIGQVMSKVYSKQSSKSLLKQAQSKKEKNPTEAIALVEEAINKAKKKEKREVEGQAYQLLGEIYEQIGQHDLAIQRYQKALPRSGSEKDSQAKAILHERIGQLYLIKEDDSNAETYFRLCIDNSIDKSLILKCSEGLVDVKLLQQNNVAVDLALDSITSNYDLDSVGIAKVEARRSINYTQQNNVAKANESYLNSIENLPKNKIASKDTYVPIEKAKKDLLESEKLSPDDKVIIQNSIADNEDLNIRPESQLAVNFDIAVFNAGENNLPVATQYIDVSKKLITPNTRPDISAEIFKLSSEINQRTGNINEALEDVENYKIASEKSIQVLENDLKQQIEIVKSQQQLDISQRDFSLNRSKITLVETQLFIQKLIIGFLTALIIGSLIFFYFQYKNVKEKRKANQKLLLKSLRTQMNPHFIFNALNSVNNFIAKNDEKAANKFLADFSRLMRKVLDYSQMDFISFEEEIELNELYLKLEHFRFRDKFDYTFENNIKQQAYQVDIPPMLIQPFIENAVWHGLRYKEGQGHLAISINEVAKHILVNIKDDGIGREKSKALKTQNQKKYKSTGLQNVNKRIELINELYDKNYEISVSDLSSDTEDTGTIVEIKIPII